MSDRTAGDLDLSTRPTRAHASGGVRLVALVAAHFYAAMAALQFGVAMGLPFGEHLWGGGQEAVLPPGMRIASLAAAGVLSWMMLVVLARGEVIRRRPVPLSWLGRTTWLIAASMVLDTLGNVASQSVVEQRVLGPITATMAVLTLVVARRGGGGTR